MNGKQQGSSRFFPDQFDQGRALYRDLHPASIRAVLGYGARDFAQQHNLTGRNRKELSHSRSNNEVTSYVGHEINPPPHQHRGKN